MKTKTTTFQSPSSAAWRRWAAPASIVVVLVFAVVFPQQIAKDNIWNLFFNIALGVTIGQSWNMLGGFAGQTSLGHAAFFGIGSIVTRTLWFHGTPFILAFIVGGCAAVTFAMIIGAPTFRLRGAYFAIGTLAVAEVMRITIGQNQPLISTMTGAQIAVYNLPRTYYVALALAIVTTARSLGIAPLPLEPGHPRCARRPGSGTVHRCARSAAQAVDTRHQRALHGLRRRRVRLPADQLLP